MWLSTNGVKTMLTKDDKDWIALLEGKDVPDANPDTLDEVRALKIALHTELQWQKLQARIQAEKAKNTKSESKPTLLDRLKRFWKNAILEPIYDWLNWKPLALVATHSIAIIATVLFMTHVQFEELLSKSSPPVPSNNCSSGYQLRLDSEAEKAALSMKQKLKSYGEKVSYQQINDKAFFLEILPTKTPSQQRRDFWDEESINDPINCSVGFIFIVSTTN